MLNFTKLHLTHEFFRILTVFSQFLWNLTIILTDFHEECSLVLMQKTNYIFSIWKTKKKECNIFFKLFWYKVFVHLKFKLLNFLVDSVFSWISSPFAWIKIVKTNNKEQFCDRDNVSEIVYEFRSITSLSYALCFKLLKTHVLVLKTLHQKSYI